MRMRFCSQNNSSNQMSKHDSKLHQLPYFIRCLAQFSDCIQHHPILDMESRCGRPFSTLKCIISIDLFSVCVCHHKPYLIHVDSIGRSGLLLLCQLCYYTNIQNFSNIWRLNENRGCSCEKAKWWTFRCHFLWILECSSSTSTTYSDLNQITNFIWFSIHIWQSSWV